MEFIEVTPVFIVDSVLCRRCRRLFLRWAPRSVSCGLEAVARRTERFPRCVFWVGRPSAPNVSFKSLIIAAYSECWVRMCYEAILYNVGGTVLKGKGKKDCPLFAFDRTNVSCVEGEAGGTNLELCPPQ